MSIFDTVIYHPVPTDMDLIRMYRAFSQECWCAGWIGSPEDMGDDFIKWLREDYAAFRQGPDERETLDFELAEVPTLRKMCAKALETMAAGEKIAEAAIVKISVPKAEGITVAEDTLTAELSDGRTISVPLSWYPRLVHATQEERDNWELFGEGRYIHWPDLDEDLSTEALLDGWPSRENQWSFNQWLAAKREGRGLTIYELNAYEKERQQRGDDVQ